MIIRNTTYNVADKGNIYSYNNILIIVNIFRTAFVYKSGILLFLVYNGEIFYVNSITITNRAYTYKVHNTTIVFDTNSWCMVGDTLYSKRCTLLTVNIPQPHYIKCTLWKS